MQSVGAPDAPQCLAVTTAIALRRAAGIRLALVALLLFALQPLLHAHPLGQLPDLHPEGLHAPGPDFARAAVGGGSPAPDPVAVSDANRIDDVALHGPADRGPVLARPASACSAAAPAIPRPQPRCRAHAPRGPPR